MTKLIILYIYCVISFYILMVTTAKEIPQEIDIYDL
jgi:hypothetical protein